MLKLSEIKQLLRQDEINLCAVARSAGLQYHQLRGVIKNKNPRYLSVEKISDYLESKGLNLFLNKG